MAEESAPTKILIAEGSNPDPIDLEARPFGNKGNDHRGEMDLRRRLYQAAVTGDDDLLKTLLDGNVDRHQLLLSPCYADGNTCLHITVMGGRHYRFIKSVLRYVPKLASVRNGRGLTPLYLAAGSQDKEVGDWIWHAIVRYVPKSEIKSLAMDTDDNGDAAAHHALRNGHTYLASELIKSTPKVAALVNKRSESLMYLACWNGHTPVFRQLLETPGSARDAPAGKSVLTAAVLTGKTEIVEEFLKHDGETTIASNELFEALICAIRGRKLEIVEMLLSRDYKLGLHVSEAGQSAFFCAAEQGNVSSGKLIIKLCYFPSAFFSDYRGRSALHIAIEKGHTQFVKFILRTPELGRLVNQADDLGDTPLHLAAKHGRPRIVQALLTDKRRQHFAVNNDGFTALDLAYFQAYKEMGGIICSEVVTLLSDASCPLAGPYQAQEEAKQQLMESITEHAKSVTRAYRKSTSTVGILITTITFAAAFTLPGGYINDKGPTEGLPVFSRKPALQAFLISDTLAMCSSLMAAFICNMYRLSDVDFVLYYSKKIGYLMWFSYSTMAVAFATGLYTVLAPTNLWLSIFICVLCGIIPPLSYLVVQWPQRKLDHQLRSVIISTYKKHVRNLSIFGISCHFSSFEDR